MTEYIKKMLNNFYPTKKDQFGREYGYVRTIK